MCSTYSIKRDAHFPQIQAFLGRKGELVMEDDENVATMDGPINKGMGGGIPILSTYICSTNNFDSHDI